MNAQLPALGIALAAIQFIDAILCATTISERFTRYLNGEFDRLKLSSLTQRAMPPIKIAAGIGLLIGLWAPLIGAVTAAALAAYFIAAIGAHARAADPPARYLNASVMLALTIAVLAATYLPAI